MICCVTTVNFRLRVSSAASLLSDPLFPNLRVVVLIRDPRGFMSSRAKIPWCAHPTCSDPDTACQHLEEDVNAANELKKEFPGRVHLVR